MYNTTESELPNLKTQFHQIGLSAPWANIFDLNRWHDDIHQLNSAGFSLIAQCKQLHYRLIHYIVNHGESKDP